MIAVYKTSTSKLYNFTFQTNNTRFVKMNVLLYSDFWRICRSCSYFCIALDHVKSNMKTFSNSDIH